MATITDIESFNNQICSDYHINIRQTTTDEPVKIFLSKIVLYKRSEYFKNVVFKYSTDNHTDIVLSEHDYGCDVDVEHIEMFFKALYEIYDDKSENLCKIIRIANFYGSITVMNKCAGVLINLMTYEMATEIIAFMDTDIIVGLNVLALVKHAERLIMTEFTSIKWSLYKFNDAGEDSNVANCRKIPYQSIMAIFKNELIDEINPNILFNFVIYWVLYDHEKRNIYMKNFLPLIKFGYMEPFYIRYFLFECFDKYFPDQLPVLENIITCNEFFRIYSNENSSMDNLLPKEFNIENFHDEGLNYSCKTILNKCDLIVDEDVKNRLISRINICCGEFACSGGFYYQLLFKITDIPSDDLDKYVCFNPIKRKLSEKVVGGKKLYWNIYVKIFKPFNDNGMFTNKYFFKYTATISINGKRYKTHKRSDCINSEQYLCTLFEFDPDNDITIDDLTRACKIINDNDNGEEILGFASEIFNHR